MKNLSKAIIAAIGLLTASCQAMPTDSTTATPAPTPQIPAVAVSGSSSPKVISLYGKLPKKDCTRSRTFCEVTVPLGHLIYTDGGGNAATHLSNFVFNVIQFYISGTDSGPLITNWVVNYDQYNSTEDYPAGYESVYIRFLDQYGNYLPDVANIILDRNACRNLGHKTQAGLLDDVFKRGAVSYEITQQTLSSTLGGC